MSNEDLQWTTIHSKLTHEGERFSAYCDKVRLSNGTETSFEYVHEPPAVVILPFTASGKVLTIQEWRQPVKRTVTGLPGGSLEGESPESAARRELLEETGYITSTLDSLATVETTNGLTDGVHHHFVAQDCSREQDVNLESKESISVEPRRFKDLYDAVISGTVRDAKTVVAVLRYAAEPKI